MPSIIDVTEQTFATEVLESNRPVFVDFWADWCGPCKSLAPVLDELADQFPQVKFCKIDTDANPGLAARQGVMSLPTLQVVEGGEVVQSLQGTRPKADLMAMIEPYV